MNNSTRASTASSESPLLIPDSSSPTSHAFSENNSIMENNGIGENNDLMENNDLTENNDLMENNDMMDNAGEHVVLATVTVQTNSSEFDSYDSPLDAEQDLNFDADNESDDDIVVETVEINESMENSDGMEISLESSPACRARHLPLTLGEKLRKDRWHLLRCSGHKLQRTRSADWASRQQLLVRKRLLAATRAQRCASVDAAAMRGDALAAMVKEAADGPVPSIVLLDHDNLQSLLADSHIHPDIHF